MWCLLEGEGTKLLMNVFKISLLLHVNMKHVVLLRFQFNSIVITEHALLELSLLDLFRFALWIHFVIFFLRELCSHKENLYSSIVCSFGVLGIEPGPYTCWTGALPLSYMHSQQKLPPLCC